VGSDPAYVWRSTFGIFAMLAMMHRALVSREHHFAGKLQWIVDLYQVKSCCFGVYQALSGKALI